MTAIQAVACLYLLLGILVAWFVYDAGRDMFSALAALSPPNTEGLSAPLPAGVGWPWIAVSVGVLAQALAVSVGLLGLASLIENTIGARISAKAAATIAARGEQAARQV